MVSDNALFMRRCFDLAKLGIGRTYTNPCVGSVIIGSDQIIGEGYHHAYGLAHAEADALQNMQTSGYDAAQIDRVLVSLEPCNHYGKTPPCAKLLHDHQVRETIVSCLDENDSGHGGGLSYLAAKGCKVTAGLLQSLGEKVIQAYHVNQTKKRPYLILKWAQSPDGLMGRKGSQVKISNPASDRLVHKWRAEVDAIMVGTETALVDNPRLNTRLYYGKHPLRIVLDRTGRLPNHLHLFDHSCETMVVSELESTGVPGVSLFTHPFDERLFPSLFDHLLAKNVSVLMVEGGALLLESLVRAGWWDECRIIIGSQPLQEGILAPKVNVPATRKISMMGDLIVQYIAPDS